MLAAAPERNRGCRSRSLVAVSHPPPRLPGSVRWHTLKEIPDDAGPTPIPPCRYASAMRPSGEAANPASDNRSDLPPRVGPVLFFRGCSEDYQHLAAIVV